MSPIRKLRRIWHHPGLNKSLVTWLDLNVGNVRTDKTKKNIEGDRIVLAKNQHPVEVVTIDSMNVVVSAYMCSPADDACQCFNFLRILFDSLTVSPTTKSKIAQKKKKKKSAGFYTQYDRKTKFSSLNFFFH